MNLEIAKVLKRLHYPLDVMLTCVRWYVAYPLSLRQLEEMMAERGILHDINAERETPIVIRQAKYLNNIVEQDHRAIKRIARPMLGFKAFRCARILLGGIELMHMVAKGQMQRSGGAAASAAQQFYSLAA
ncbi:DDE domain-containing protein [Cupriavidus necator]|uniref:DDE domain-containing protein n=1 Tax=Cupriavidus necator TaxID=106590 RepID=A0A1U9UNF9_CUPNE|nr:DDE-type integrase/transposase/recombinase [Cupriavidus necator]AQV94130.1 DDE domain-containing protein [Cupriavidus necator]